MTLRRPITIRKFVYEQIKSNILSGVYRPGQRLTETNLAEELEVSRTPVRDALNRLETEGLITTSAHKGIFVTEITEKDIRDFYQTRTVLEGLAAQLAAIHATDKELENFTAFMDEARLIFERDKELLNYKEIAESNNKFHKMICDMAKNEVLTKTLATLDSAITLIRSTSWSDHQRKYQTFLEHEEIAAAILDRDAELAKIKGEAHIISAQQSAEKAIQSKSDDSVP